MTFGPRSQPRCCRPSQRAALSWGRASCGGGAPCGGGASRDTAEKCKTAKVPSISSRFSFPLRFSRGAWTRAHAHVSVGITLLPPSALPLPIPVMCSVGEMCHPSASVHRGSSPRGHMHERVHPHPQMLSELGVVSCQHRRRPTPTL